MLTQPSWPLNVTSKLSLPISDGWAHILFMKAPSGTRPMCVLDVILHQQSILDVKHVRVDQVNH